MAKKKKTKKSPSALDNLQMKPLMIAFVAGLFIGIQASRAGTMPMLVLGVLAGVGASVAVYLIQERKKQAKENLVGAEIRSSARRGGGRWARQRAQALHAGKETCCRPWQ